MPVTLKGSTMALELIKEVTDSLLVNDTHHQESLLLYDLIRQINDVAVRDLYTGLFNKRYAEQELSKLTFEWDGSVERLLNRPVYRSRTATSLICRIKS